MFFMNDIFYVILKNIMNNLQENTVMQNQENVNIYQIILNFITLFQANAGIQGSLLLVIFSMQLIMLLQNTRYFKYMTSNSSNKFIKDCEIIEERDRTLEYDNDDDDDSGEDSDEFGSSYKMKNLKTKLKMKI